MTADCKKTEAKCNGKCVNKNTDANNCGGCNKKCAKGESCAQGKCKSSGNSMGSTTADCKQNEAKCNGKCVNKNTDVNNCGSCNKKCAKGESCAQGKCKGKLMGGSPTPQGVGTKCSGGGTCQLTSTACSGTFVKGLCPGASNVQCCQPKGSNSMGGPTPNPQPSTGMWLTKAGHFTVENLDRTHKGYSTGPQSHALNKFLLHTIEGSWPKNGDWEGGTATLDQHGYWPHFIVARDKTGTLRIGQYLPMNNWARALETGNADGVVQVEIGAKAASPFTENDADITAAVKILYHAVSAATGIPIKVDPRVKFTGVGGAGKNAAQRLSKSVFLEVEGLCGHSTVYDNSHWDPGAITPSKLL